MVTIERALPGDLPATLDLLRRSDLPTEGLDVHGSTLFVARDGDRVVGCAALEVYGSAALLRSVAVDRSLRGRGLGGRLTAAALRRATELDIQGVYLLTETAESFFPRYGFRAVDRAEVPADVRGSIEFTSLCPKSAVAMKADL